MQVKFIAGLDATQQQLHIYLVKGILQNFQIYGQHAILFLSIKKSYNSFTTVEPNYQALLSQGNNSHKILDYSNKEFWGYYGRGNRSYTITAAVDGILCGYLSVYAAQVNIYINDVFVGTMTSNDGGGSVGSSFSHPIYKGDIIKIEGKSSSGYSNNAVLYFIPYK